MNTVTIGLEEYLELRKLRDAVQFEHYTVYLLDGWTKGVTWTRYYIYTNDEAVKELIDINKNLSDKIVAQSELIPKKKKWWKF